MVWKNVGKSHRRTALPKTLLACSCQGQRLLDNKMAVTGLFRLAALRLETGLFIVSGHDTHNYGRCINNGKAKVLAIIRNMHSYRSWHGKRCFSSTPPINPGPSGSASFAKKLRHVGLCTFAVGIGGYFLYKSTISSPALQADGPLQIKPSRSIVNDQDKTGLKLVLFQYQTCPFCCKVRAYFDYLGISYDVIEVNPVLRQQIKFSKWKKVPIVLANDGKGVQQLNDSSMIISLLHSYLLDCKQNLEDLVAAYPLITYENDDKKVVTEILNRHYIMFGDKPKVKRADKDILEERSWRKWVDTELVHTLSPNVYRTPAEAKQAFNWFSEVGEWEKHFPFWERILVIYVGATAMYFVGKRLKNRHRLKDDVRMSLYEECSKWTKAIGPKRNFMGGNSPNLADLAVYGVLNAIEGCDAFQDLLRNTDIEPWYDRMKESVKTHSGSREIVR